MAVAAKMTGLWGAGLQSFRRMLKKLEVCLTQGPLKLDFCYVFNLMRVAKTLVLVGNGCKEDIANADF